MKRATGQDCDSDADTVVCVLSDDESELVRRKKKRSIKNRIIRNPPRWSDSHVAASSGQRPPSSEVIYVKASDSDSDGEDEDDCVIVESASPGGKASSATAARLPADFFDRETPPLSPRRIPQRAPSPRPPELSSRAGEARDKRVKVKDIQVKLTRIDELLLGDIGVSSCDVERCVIESVSRNAVSETKQTTNVGKLDKHNSVSPKNMSSTGTFFPREMSPQKRNEICKNSSHKVKSRSPDKSKKIRITLEIPYSKIFQFDNNKQSKLVALSSSGHSHKTSNPKISKEKTDKKHSKSQHTSKNVEGNTELVTIDLTKERDKPQKDASRDSGESRKRAKKSKRHSSKDMRYRCEICWLRVPNVTDHIVKEHTHLFM